jgi:hypothetical protein
METSSNPILHFTAVNPAVFRRIHFRDLHGFAPAENREGAKNREGASHLRRNQWRNQLLRLTCVVTIRLSLLAVQW